WPSGAPRPPYPPPSGGASSRAPSPGVERSAAPAGLRRGRARSRRHRGLGEHEARGAGANAGLAELTLELPERGALRVERLAAPEKPQRLATEALAGRRLLV